MDYKKYPFGPDELVRNYTDRAQGANTGGCLLAHTTI